jgi:capsular polysaccharide export protein
MHGGRFINPFTGEEWNADDAAALLADWHRIADENRQIAVCLGMSIWKQRRMRDLLSAPGHAPRFRTGTASAIRLAKAEGGAVAVWATREPPNLAAAAEQAGLPVVRIEDGFLRSVGLGADFTQAASIVADRKGLYYDPRTPSGLDDILNTADFSPALIERARKLMTKLVAGGITKYNVGGAMPAIDTPAGAKLLFVPGQVENDRSVQLGGAGIHSNLALLERVRRENPGAFILYKPHPDVDAGHRPGAIPDTDALRFADRTIRGVSSAAIIAAVDEIHTLTSLVGFEALVRGKRVAVYGQPFYASWGLTADRTQVPHRTRRITLEQLVAGTLILYPRYIDPVTRLPCGPEILIERLSHPELWRPGPLVRLRRLQGAVTRRVRHHLASAVPSHL